MFGRGRASQGSRASRTDNVEVQESFTPLERAKHLGNSKLSLQRLVFVYELVETAHEIGYEDTVKQLLPLVKKLAGDVEILVRQKLVPHFGDLAGFLIQSDPERGYEEVLDKILPLISALLCEKAAEVNQAAIEALIALASHLRPNGMTHMVLRTVISMSQNDEVEDSRCTAVVLLNNLAEMLGPDLCRQFSIPSLAALSQDPFMRVRMVTASNLAEVAKVAGTRDAHSRLVDVIKELAGDKMWHVRKAVVEHLTTFAMEIAVETREAQLLPLMSAFLDDMQEPVRTAACQQLGYFIGCLETPDRVPEGLVRKYTDIIHYMATGTDILYHSAYTFSAVLKAVGPTQWLRLGDVFGLMVMYPDTRAKKALAASLHVVAEILGPHRVLRQVLPNLSILMIATDNVDVRLASLKNVAHIMRVANCVEVNICIVRMLSSLWAKASSLGWRVRQVLAQQIGAICEYLAVSGHEQKTAAQLGGPDVVNSLEAMCDSDPGLPADTVDSNATLPGTSASSAVEREVDTEDLVWDRLLPLFFQLCDDSVAEVRDEAARVTAKFLRAAVPELFAESSNGEGSSGCLALPAKPSRLVRRLVHTFARGRSFRSRITFIRMCDSIIRESPMHVFTEHFLRPFVRLSRDRTRNVLLCWASVVAPHLRKAGRLGTNEILLVAAHRMAYRLSEQDEKRRRFPEERRILEAAPIGAMPPGYDFVPAGQESDWTDDMDGEEEDDATSAAEGGTGDSLDLGAAEEVAPKPTDAAQAPSGSAQCSGTSPSSSSSSPARGPGSFAPPPRTDSGEEALRPGTTPDALPSEAISSTSSSSSSSSSSPAGARASPSSATPPRSPAGGGGPGARWQAHDLVEDGLVEQQEMDREMDSAFSDRRLLHEAEKDAPEEFGRRPSDEDVLENLGSLPDPEASAPSANLPNPPPTAEAEAKAEPDAPIAEDANQ